MKCVMIEMLGVSTGPSTYVFSSSDGATRKMLVPVVRTTKHLFAVLAGQVVVASATGSDTSARALEITHPQKLKMGALGGGTNILYAEGSIWAGTSVFGSPPIQDLAIIVQ